MVPPWRVGGETAGQWNRVRRPGVDGDVNGTFVQWKGGAPAQRGSDGSLGDGAEAAGCPSRQETSWDVCFPAPGFHWVQDLNVK